MTKSEYNETDYIIYQGWQEIDPICHIIQTFEYAVLSCPLRQEVLSTNHFNETAIVLDEDREQHEHKTFKQRVGSRNAYTLTSPEDSELHIYEVEISNIDIEN